jgi:hypothetical protein
VRGGSRIFYLLCVLAETKISPTQNNPTGYLALVINKLHTNDRRRMAYYFLSALHGSCSFTRHDPYLPSASLICSLPPFLPLLSLSSSSSLPRSLLAPSLPRSLPHSLTLDAHRSLAHSLLMPITQSFTPSLPPSLPSLPPFLPSSLGLFERNTQRRHIPPRRPLR